MSGPRPIAHLRWSIERMTPHGFEAVCFWCEQPFTVDVVAAVFRHGPEIVGIMCSDCVTPETRRHLAAAAARWRAKPEAMR